MIKKAAEEGSGMFGIYRINGQSCAITEVIAHERAKIPASDLIHAYPENYMPSIGSAEYLRSAIIRVYKSGQSNSITVPIATRPGKSENRHIHLEKNDAISIIATVGWIHPKDAQIPDDPD